ncbi:MAG: hypothetical protein KDK78_10980 [Chlamydiia bacterium]|nr:hypothetical protein [Chlamydiia bacterium]
MPRKTLDPSLAERVELTVSQALLWIFLSTLLVTGSCTLAWLYYETLVQRRGEDPRYNVRAIAQRGPSAGRLDSNYLAELLGLSSDQPANLYRLSTRELRRRLLASPLFLDAEVDAINPDVLVVDYTLRSPSFRLGNAANTLLDSDGMLFPAAPFFNGDSYPILWIEDAALPSGRWGSAVAAQYLLEATQLRDVFAELWPDLALREIDLSRANADSEGRREWVLVLESGAQIRLDPGSGVDALRRLKRVSFEMEGELDCRSGRFVLKKERTSSEGSLSALSKG